MKIIIYIFFFFCSLQLNAQQYKEQFYLFDADWSAAPTLDSATYFMQMISETDTAFTCRYYHKFGPMLKQECYKDADFSLPHGFFAWYDSEGKIDSSGFVYEGKKDSRWNYYDDSMKILFTKYYERGKYLNTEDVNVGREAALKDSLGEKEININQTEAKYPGGIKAWTKYLQKNLQTPERLINISSSTRKDITAITGIEFIIDKQGNISDLCIFKSFEWSADSEALRVIKSGGKWIPAQQDGHSVFYRQRQQIRFEVKGN